MSRVECRGSKVEVRGRKSRVENGNLFILLIIHLSTIFFVLVVKRFSYN
jgi:hypothetical protein